MQLRSGKCTIIPATEEYIRWICENTGEIDIPDEAALAIRRELAQIIRESPEVRGHRHLTVERASEESQHEETGRCPNCNKLGNVGEICGNRDCSDDCWVVC